MKRATNDASLTKLGDIYQYYRALLDCFSLEKDETLLIEVYGDISILSYKKENCIQKEIKHHIGETKLSDRSLDFWNTIKNWVVDYDVSKKFSKLKFYTTSLLPKTCNLYGWDNKNKAQRYDILVGIGKEHKSREEKFRKLYDAIFGSTKISKNQIEDVLEKVEILSLQEHIDELDSEFEKHISYVIPEDNQQYYLEGLLGAIIGKLKDPPHIWEITKTEFNKIAQIYAGAFVNIEKKPLSDIFLELEPSDSEKESLCKKRFVTEIKRIDYSRRIPEAVGDYWRMNKTVKKYYDNDPTFNKSLFSYRDRLKRKIKDEKECEALDLVSNEENEIIRSSKKLYANVMKMQVEDFGTIIQNQAFFQCGVVHDIVNEGEFVWYIGEENEY